MCIFSTFLTDQNSTELCKNTNKRLRKSFENLYIFAQASSIFWCVNKTEREKLLDALHHPVLVGQNRLQSLSKHQFLNGSDLMKFGDK